MATRSIPPKTPVKDSEVPTINFEGWASKTATISEPVLLVSLISNTFPLGSTVAIFARVPEVVGVTAKVTLNEEPIGNTTPPFATQLRVVPVIEQSIIPIGGIPFWTINGP